MTDYFHLDASPGQIQAISTLGLAHLGDGVFELMVRSWLCLHGKATSKGLHRAAVRYVAAPAQARAAERLLPLLGEEEGDVVRPGGATTPPPRAPHPRPGGHPAPPRGGGPFGWLWLQGRTERLNELFAVVMEEEECR